PNRPRQLAQSTHQLWLGRAVLRQIRHEVAEDIRPLFGFLDVFDDRERVLAIRNRSLFGADSRTGNEPQPACPVGSAASAVPSRDGTFPTAPTEPDVTGSGHPALQCSFP